MDEFISWAGSWLENAGSWLFSFDFQGALIGVVGVIIVGAVLWVVANN